MYERPLRVEVTALYQVVRPRYLDALAQHDTPEIRALRAMAAASPPPVEVLDRATVRVP